MLAIDSDLEILSVSSNRSLPREAITRGKLLIVLLFFFFLVPDVSGAGMSSLTLRLTNYSCSVSISEFDSFEVIFIDL